MTTGLGVIRGRDVVPCPSFLEKVLKGQVNEVRPSVIDYHPWCAKPWEDNLVKHLMGVLCIWGLHGMALTHLET